jgi:hypothetical protein
MIEFLQRIQGAGLAGEHVETAAPHPTFDRVSSGSKLSDDTNSAGKVNPSGVATLGLG